MTELLSIINTPIFQSKESIKTQLLDLGITAGDNLIVHSSLKAMGWIAGGAHAVVEALLEAVTDEGTIVMPAQSPDNSEPSYWMAPPVPQDWHQPIRDHYPAYDPQLTQLRGMGKVAECFHRHPKTIRSMHPAHSFMAWGRFAASWMSEHPLEDSFGERSPLGKMMRHNVKILLIGVGFDSCTALHFAEFSQPNRTTSPQGAAVMQDGKRIWQTYDCVDMDADRFPVIAADYDGEITKGKLGQATALLMDMKPLVDFGTAWLKQHPASKQ